MRVLAQLQKSPPLDQSVEKLSGVFIGREFPIGRGALCWAAEVHPVRCSEGFGGGWQGDLLTAFLLSVRTAARKNCSDASRIGTVTSSIAKRDRLEQPRRVSRCLAQLSQKRTLWSWARAASKLCWAGCSVRGRQGGELAELIDRFPLWFSSSTS